jgi:hypothetical protein
MTSISGQVNISIQDNGENLGYLCPIGQIFMRHPVKTPCGHIFEEICINDWLKRSTICPMDRRQVTKEQLVLQTDFQEEIRHYLEQHPEEDDQEEYSMLLAEYNKSLSPKAILQREGHRNLPRNWRATLQRTHRLALLFLTLSTTAWVITAFLDNDNNHVETGLVSIKNKAFCLMLASLGVTVITSDYVVNCWNRN